MKVCYIYQDQYPWDIRVDKITKSLADRGVKTYIVSRNRTGIARREQLRDNLFVRRLCAGRRGLVRDMLNFPAFFSPFWFTEILATVAKERIDVIIVRDLPLAPTAYSVARITGKPVIMDMAENYPAMIHDTWVYGKMNSIDHIVRNPRLLRKLEAVIVPNLDGIFVVSPQSKVRVEKLLRHRNKPVWVIGNTPRLEEKGAEGLSIPILNTLKQRRELLLLYVGGFEEARGLETVVKAMPDIVRTLHAVTLVLVGTGQSQAGLESLATELKVRDKILFTGWIPQEYIPGTIATADICLIPHYVTEHTTTTLPNKLFDYMARKKPVIATNSPSLEHVLHSCNCGLTYPDKDHQKLAKTVIALKDQARRKKLGEAGFEAVLRRYNWGIEEEVLMTAVNKIAMQKRLWPRFR